MTDRELMQQALDALDKLLDKLNADICDNSGIWDEYFDGGNAIQALRARLAQPEPEPVAWWHDRGDFVDLNVSGHGTPLYFAPPQREWQGLTDEERYLNEARSAEEIEYAKAIEAKLKEKNQ